MVVFEHTIQSEAGLHARPAGLFVKKAQSLPDDVSIVKGDKTADGKRLFAVIGLGVKQGDQITISVDGETAADSASQLETFCKENIWTLGEKNVHAKAAQIIILCWKYKCSRCSIVTTQYTLALDRQNESVSSFCDETHQAVLRLIRMAADNAHVNGIPIGICGELAADPELAQVFIDLEIGELSVVPSSILPLRKQICELD